MINIAFFIFPSTVLNNEQLDLMSKLHTADFRILSK